MDRKPQSSLAHQRLRGLFESLRCAIAPLRLRRADSVGRRPRIHGTPYIENWGRLRIGDDFTVWSRPAQSHLVIRPRATISIGNRVTIGAGAAIASEECIDIGDNVTIGSFVMIMDTDFHDVSDVARPGSTDAVVIEEQVQIESGVTILKGSHVKKRARVASGSVVSGLVPEGAYVRGVPARLASAARTSRDPLPDPSDRLRRIQDLVARTFGLEDAPRLEHGPHQIAGWDSLGTLRLMLALEEEFRIILPEAALCDISTLHDVSEIVGEALHGA
jgi:acetyltransferase-like isoleucine patch superfamily enzyme/acyl carrier protein